MIIRRGAPRARLRAIPGEQSAVCRRWTREAGPCDDARMTSTRWLQVALAAAGVALGVLAYEVQMNNVVTTTSPRSWGPWSRPGRSFSPGSSPGRGDRRIGSGRSWLRPASRSSRASFGTALLADSCARRSRRQNSDQASDEQTHSELSSLAHEVPPLFSSELGGHGCLSRLEKRSRHPRSRSRAMSERLRDQCRWLSGGSHRGVSCGVKHGDLRMDLGTPRRLAALGAEEIDRREVAVDLLDELLRICLLEHDFRVHHGAQDPLKSSGTDAPIRCRACRARRPRPGSGLRERRASARGRPCTDRARGRGSGSFPAPTDRRTRTRVG